MSRDPTLLDGQVEARDSMPSATATATEAGSGPAAARESRLGPVHERGQLLGRYVLLEPIGQGGMGVVYAAYDPELDRRVALKLLRSRTNEKTGHARLMREAQAMAKVVHPHVITVHDVGTYDGAVFIAMELVDGGDLQQWLDAEPRAWSRIVAVLADAGAGLAAAHRAGLIHRDFKPGNVLLDADEGVKVVDFGLARQLDAGLDTNELRMLEKKLESSHPSSTSLSDGVTRTGALLGTPAYMAPEQHARRELDARADQFSFCVTLYEALWNRRPFEADSRMALAIATNRGQVLPPPKGSPVPASIVRAIMRGLSARPEDRFPTMAALLAELDHEPGRRRRQWIVGGTAVALLSVAVAGSLQQTETAASPCADPRSAIEPSWTPGDRTAIERAFAASPLPYASSTSAFVVRRIDTWVDTWVEARRDACEATHVAQTQTTDELALRQGCLDRQRKGLTAITRLLAEADAKTIERADAMVASLPSPDACADVQALRRVPLPADTATREAVDAIRDTLGEIRALRAAGRYEQALPLSRDARARADETQYLPVVAEALLMEAELVGYSDNRVKAEALLHQAARAATEARHDEVLAEIWLDLARHMSIAQSQHEQAWRWAGYAEAVINRLGRPPWFRAQLLCTQGNLLWASQKSAEALPRLQSCLELRRADSPDSSLIAATLTHIGNAQIDLGQHEDAERSFRRALDLATASRGPKHPQVAISHNGLGVAYYMQGRLADAEAQYQAAYDLNLELLGPDNPELLYSMGNVANCRRERGQYALALASMRKVEALVRRAFPPEHREVGTTLHNIAELLALQDEPEQALDHYQRALPIRTKVHGATSRWVGNTLTGQGEVLLALGRNRRALESLERAMEARTADAAGRRVDHGRTRFALARALERTGGDMARAQRLVETAREDFTEVDGALDEQRRDAIVAWLAAHAPKP